MRFRPSALGVGAAVVALVGVSAGSGAVWGAFSDATTNSGNEVRSVADFVAPLTSAATLQKSTGGTPGFVRSGASYRVFAAVTDSGRPSSGIVAVSTGANGGPTGIALTAGSYAAIGGVTYTHRSALQTFGTIPAGTFAFSIGSADAAGNGRTQNGFSYVTDNTAPAPVDVSTANRTGGIVGHPEAGDTMALAFNEPIDAISVVAGWDGAAATSVVVRLTNGFNGANDTVAFYNQANSAALPLGTVDLGRADYTTSSRTFGASGTASTLAVAGNGLAVTLGTASGLTTTASNSGTLRWSAAPGPTDRAGNPLSATVRVESGTTDRDF
jgi:hypothetical protein